MCQIIKDILTSCAYEIFTLLGNDTQDLLFGDGIYIFPCPVCRWATAALSRLVMYIDLGFVCFFLYVVTELSVSTYLFIYLTRVQGRVGDDGCCVAWLSTF